MADRLSTAERSALMARIRGTNTKPEVLVRSALHRAGYRFRIHASGLPGRPDIVLARHRTVVLVHGCFWHRHGCAMSSTPSTRRAFWLEKFRRNRERDARTARALRALGWRVVTVWECSLRTAPRRAQAIARLLRMLERDARTRGNGGSGGVGARRASAATPTRRNAPKGARKASARPEKARTRQG